MKKIVSLLISFCFQQISFSQTVPLDSAKFYEGKTITVCSQVMDTYVSKHEDATTFINFGNPYPHSTFSVVIFEKDLTNFKYTPSEYLKGKNICITGKITIYKDKPQMIVESEEAIKVQ